MNFPEVVADLVEAQNNYNSIAYANCFSETAIVFDEGNTYNGRTEIQNWIADANEKYRSVMKPINFVANETESVLLAEVSVNFEGTPIDLYCHFQITDDQIESLKITV